MAPAKTSHIFYFLRWARFFVHFFFTRFYYDIITTILFLQLPPVAAHPFVSKLALSTIPSICIIADDKKKIIYLFIIKHRKPVQLKILFFLNFTLISLLTVASRYSLFVRTQGSKLLFDFLIFKFIRFLMGI